MKPEVFREFLREAYIEPVRSVLIVDDDYPTFDEILSKAKTDKRWREKPDDVLNVISQFRKNQPMMVDIHDGQNVDFGAEAKAISYLHQSDLLILDYELDRGQKDGSRAIGIVRNVLENNHFNLILVHTREELSQVFTSMLLGVLSKQIVMLSPEDTKAAQALVEAAELEHEDIVDELLASMGLQQYLKFREDPKGQLPIDEVVFGQFKAICQKAAWNDEGARQFVAKWTLEKVHKTFVRQMNRNGPRELSWSAEQPFWIRCNSGFIAFTNKADGSDINLIDQLLDGLCNWGPRPSRLFLVKLRAEMERAGVVAEDRALGTKHAHANWYSRLLAAEKAPREFLLAETLSRSSEKLLAEVLPKISDFAARLVESEDTPDGVEAIIKSRFGVDLTDGLEAKKARNEHNVFVCSKEVEGYHLALGHIFEAGQEYWICLTPACDLVPGQKKVGRFSGIGEHLPFTAVRLHKVEQPESTNPSNKHNKRYSKALNTGRYFIVDLGGELQTFSLNEPDDESASPLWHSLFVAEQGRFDKATKKINLFRTQEVEKIGLTASPLEGKIVAQLRYEYALNLMQKLGVSMTRIGLDFV